MVRDGDMLLIVIAKLGLSLMKTHQSRKFKFQQMKNRVRQQFRRLVERVVYTKLGGTRYHKKMHTYHASLACSRSRIVLSRGHPLAFLAVSLTTSITIYWSTPSMT